MYKIFHILHIILFLLSCVADNRIILICKYQTQGHIQIARLEIVLRSIKRSTGTRHFSSTCQYCA